MEWGTGYRSARFPSTRMWIGLSYCVGLAELALIAIVGFSTKGESASESDRTDPRPPPRCAAAGELLYVLDPRDATDDESEKAELGVYEGVGRPKIVFAPAEPP